MTGPVLPKPAPDGVLRDRVRRTRRVRRMVACDDIRRPASFSGPGTLTVLTVNLAKGLKPLDSDPISDCDPVLLSARLNNGVSSNAACGVDHDE